MTLMLTVLFTLEILLVIVGLMSVGENRKTIMLRIITVLNLIVITIVLCLLRGADINIIWVGVVCSYLINIGFCLFAKKLTNTKMSFLFTIIILTVLMFIIPAFSDIDHEHVFEKQKDNDNLPMNHMGREIIIEYDQYYNGYFLPIYKHEK